MVFDIKIRFLEVFCFRWSNFQVCTTLGAHHMRHDIFRVCNKGASQGHGEGWGRGKPLPRNWGLEVQRIPSTRSAAQRASADFAKDH